MTQVQDGRRSASQTSPRVARRLAGRAGATITEVEGSHVIMIFFSQPQVVTDVIRRAIKDVE